MKRGCNIVAMETESAITTVKIRVSTRRELKVLAAQAGKTMIEVMEELVSKEKKRLNRELSRME